mmetsp:Transcript_103738/g.291908  ORF Transcript_103738/g.291908 Transcript_103738/m.291908 type:complete len:434 (+) Transcript_103738:767-2068(+)
MHILNSCTPRGTEGLPDEGVSQSLLNIQPSPRHGLHEPQAEALRVFGELLPRLAFFVDLSQGRQSQNIQFPLSGISNAQRGVERAMPTEQQIRDDAKAPHVAAAQRRLPWVECRGLDTRRGRVELRRRVPKRAATLGRDVWLLLIPEADRGPTKVPELQHRHIEAVRRSVEHQVLGLHVAVLHPARHEVAQGEQHLPRKLSPVLLGYASLACSDIELVHVSELAILQDEDILLALEGLEEPYHMRVRPDPGQHLELLLEGDASGGPEALQRDDPVARRRLQLPRPSAGQIRRHRTRGGGAAVAGCRCGEGLVGYPRLPGAQLAPDAVSAAPLCSPVCSLLFCPDDSEALTSELGLSVEETTQLDAVLALESQCAVADRAECRIAPDLPLATDVGRGAALAALLAHRPTQAGRRPSLADWRGALGRKGPLEPPA